jgi:hypothetical protein
MSTTSQRHERRRSAGLPSMAELLWLLSRTDGDGAEVTSGSRLGEPGGRSSEMSCRRRRDGSQLGDSSSAGSWGDEEGTVLETAAGVVG